MSALTSSPASTSRVTRNGVRRDENPHSAGAEQLAWLESESLHIIREVVAEFERPALLFSGGKDSVVMLHLARKAFWPAPVPVTLLHVDTGHNFP